MGKLYEINTEIARLQERLEYDAATDTYVDLDTGEMMSEEEMQALFDELGMDKYECLCWMVKCRQNDMAEAEALKAEAKRLMERAKRFEKRAERFLAIIDRECYGMPTDFGIVSLKYTTSHPLEYDERDTENIIAFLEEHGYDDCLKYEQPKLVKDAIKKRIKAGVNIPFCRILDKKNAILK